MRASNRTSRWVLSMVCQRAISGAGRFLKLTVWLSHREFLGDVLERIKQNFEDVRLDEGFNDEI